MSNQPTLARRLGLFDAVVIGLGSMIGAGVFAAFAPAARAAGGHAMGAARPLAGAPRFAAYAAGQAGAVGHVAEHNLGAAAYAIKAVRAASPAAEAEQAGLAECAWQRSRLPEAIRALVLEDQQRRNPICWSLFQPDLAPMSPRAD